LILLLKRFRAIVAGAGEIGIEPYGFVVVLDGTAEVALAGISETAIAEGNGIFRIVPNRLVAVLHGAVEIALVQICSTAVVEGLGKLPVEPVLLVLVPDHAIKVVVLARDRRRGHQHRRRYDGRS
jgi:hypothetical protein